MDEPRLSDADRLARIEARLTAIETKLNIGVGMGKGIAIATSVFVALVCAGAWLVSYLTGGR